MKRTASKGFSTRYDADGGGNHMQRLRDRSPGSDRYFRDFANRICTICMKKKPVKGGAGIGKRFVCSDCKPKTPNANMTRRNTT